MYKNTALNKTVKDSCEDLKYFGTSVETKKVYSWGCKIIVTIQSNQQYFNLWIFRILDLINT